MKTIAVMTILRNEAEYIGYSIMAVLDYVDGFYYSDGNSTDGTIEIIEYIKKKYDRDDKIHLYKNEDCRDLRDNYAPVFNRLLKRVKEDYVFFLHPDMIVLNPEIIRGSFDEGLRYEVNVVSLAGDNREKYFEDGRMGKWAIILKNAHGLHYYGWYGTVNEDFYFKDLTGNEYVCYDFYKYRPYEILDTNINIFHYCDTKPYSRRLGRMVTCLQNQAPNCDKKTVLEYAKGHPRVTIQDGIFKNMIGTETNFVFKEFKGKQPEVFEKYKEFERFRKG